MAQTEVKVKVKLDLPAGVELLGYERYGDGHGFEVKFPLPGFNCPTRRRPMAYPLWSPRGHRNAEDMPKVARADYAANSGDYPQTEVVVDGYRGPVDYSADNWSICSGGPSPSGSGTDCWPDSSHMTGICIWRATIDIAGVRDGTTNTLMLGERYLNPDFYFNELGHGDDWSMYTGFQADIVRGTWYDPGQPDFRWQPMQDSPGLDRHHRFGSAHASGFNVTLCDGSVRSLSYSIDPEVFRRLGNRKDGKPIDGSKL